MHAESSATKTSAATPAIGGRKLEKAETMTAFTKGGLGF
jgi:hypothetical protein